jgi:uncharacterized protein
MNTGTRYLVGAGGHLLEGHVWPTLEVIIHETHAGLHKTYRPEIGLALIDLDR